MDSLPGAELVTEGLDDLRRGRDTVPAALTRVAQAKEHAGQRELIDSAPPVDADFARDVERSRDDFGPPSSAWPS